MKTYATRVKRIEQARNGKRDPNWRIVDECGHHLHVDLVENNSDLRLVQPSDTDTMTYASIQVLIAYADKDERLLNRWFDKARTPELPRQPGESDEEYLARDAELCKVESEVMEQRQQLAVENARARVAAAKPPKSQTYVSKNGAV